MEHSYSPVYDRKCIVFEHQLDRLFRRCQRCGSRIKSKSKTTQGSMLLVSTTCEKGHQITWTSQPTIERAAAGNILLSAAILISGQHFSAAFILAQFGYHGQNDFFQDTGVLALPGYSPGLGGSRCICISCSNRRGTEISW